MTTHAVTGPFGYTGRYITDTLLATGHEVRGLTDRRAASPRVIATSPYHFEDPAALTASLRGVDTLVNTYWVRFDRGSTTFDLAIARVGLLLKAARDAGVRRVVQVSVTHADPTSPLPYFRGKGVLEQMVRDCGLSYAVVRPALVVGRGDILLNNIAWFLRHVPVFGLPGGGGYRVQPIHARDLADTVVQAVSASDNQEFDAVGPDTMTFGGLVEGMRVALGSRCRVVPMPQRLALAGTALAGLVLRDCVLTADEVAGLRANLLTSDEAPIGRTTFAAWLAEDGDALGRHYANEVHRHFR